MSLPPAQPVFAALRRLVAAGSAALVLALTVFVASPTAHGWLHPDDATAQSDDACAVVLFASGVAPALDLIQVSAPLATRQRVTPVAQTEIFLVAPRYLRQPERGPPAGQGQ
jgi:hypothetical protein